MKRRLESTSDGIAVDPVGSVGTARRRLDTASPDCVVCDGRLGEDALALLADLGERNRNPPFVLTTERADEHLASEAITRGAVDSVRIDCAPDELLVRRIEMAVRTSRAERALAREQRTTESILHALETTADRREVLDALCERAVADLDAACVWVAARKQSGDLVHVVSAGLDEHLPTITGRPVQTTADATASRVGDDSDQEGRLADHPAATAMTQGAIVTRTPIGSLGDPGDADDWRAILANRGIERITAVPIGPNGDAALVVEVDGEASGDAERRHLLNHADSIADVLSIPAWTPDGGLTTDHVLEVAVRDPAAPLVALADAIDEGASLAVPSAVDRGDGATLYLARVDGVGSELLASAVRSVDGLELLAASTIEDDTIRCELLAERPTPEQRILAGGGYVVETRVAGGEATVLAEISKAGDGARIAAALEDAFDAPECRHRPADPGVDVDGEFLGALTDRQRAVLSHAYLAGYYENPRGISATELAERFDIARATVTQHLRTAERKVFDEVLTE